MYNYLSSANLGQKVQEGVEEKEEGELVLEKVEDGGKIWPSASAGGNFASKRGNGI